MRWFSTSFIGRHLHRAVHKPGRSGGAQDTACWFCRLVWWPLIDQSLAAHRPDSPVEQDRG